MSVTLDAQPELAGMPRAVQTPAPPAGTLVKGAFMGLLAEPATVRTHSNGGVSLQVLITQASAGHPHALPLLVRWHLPDMGAFDVTYQHAAAKAAAMPAGTEVVAVGRGLEAARLPRSHERANHSTQPECLRLMHCDGLELAATLNTRSQHHAH